MELSNSECPYVRIQIVRVIHLAATVVYQHHKPFATRIPTQLGVNNVKIRGVKCDPKTEMRRDAVWQY